jgi:hypothetical protein
VFVKNTENHLAIAFVFHMFNQCYLEEDKQRKREKIIHVQSYLSIAKRRSYNSSTQTRLKDTMKLSDETSKERERLYFNSSNKIIQKTTSDEKLRDHTSDKARQLTTQSRDLSMANKEARMHTYKRMSTRRHSVTLYLLIIYYGGSLDMHD